MPPLQHHQQQRQQRASWLSLACELSSIGSSCLTLMRAFQRQMAGFVGPTWVDSIFFSSLHVSLESSSTSNNVWQEAQTTTPPRPEQLHCCGGDILKVVPLFFKPNLFLFSGCRCSSCSSFADGCYFSFRFFWQCRTLLNSNKLKIILKLHLGIFENLSVGKAIRYSYSSSLCWVKFLLFFSGFYFQLVSVLIHGFSAFFFFWEPLQF